MKCLVLKKILFANTINLMKNIEKKKENENKKQSKVLKIIGIIIVIIGAIIDLIAFIDFGLTDTSVEQASLLYLFWIGSPIISIGGILIFFGYLKSIEKDRTVETFIKCDNCGKPIKLDSNYCNNCGANTEVECPQCKGMNPSGAKFCNKCGTRLK